jgi:hypothetical protein
MGRRPLPAGAEAVQRHHVQRVPQRRWVLLLAHRVMHLPARITPATPPIASTTKSSTRSATPTRPCGAENSRTALDQPLRRSDPMNPCFHLNSFNKSLNVFKGDG